MRRSISLGFACTALLLTAVPRASAGVAEVTLRLDPIGGLTSVGQGVAYPFRVTASNTGGGTEAVAVIVSLRDPGGAKQDIRSWNVSVPAGGDAHVDLSAVPAQWFAGIGDFTLSATPNGVAAGNRLTFTVTAPTVIVPRFVAVTGAAGLQTILPEDTSTSHSEGAAWDDVDADGFPDLYVPIRDAPAQLWIQDPVTHSFTDEAAAWAVTNPGGVGVSATFVDVDNDGDRDLYVVNDALDPVTALPTGQGNRLYLSMRAQGSNTFEDASAASGLGIQMNGASASWADYDGDGFVDLYAVTSNTHLPPMTYYHQDHLFHNEGDGTFTDVTCESLTTNDPDAGFCADPAFGGSTGSGFEAVWFDADRDGDQDLYLAQDHYNIHKDRNRLYRNDGFDPGSGHWRFTDLCADPIEPIRAVCRTMASMGADVGDVNGDLWPDVAVSNVGGSGGNVLLVNDGAGGFDERGRADGVDRPWQSATVTAVTWGLGFVDVNLDGWDDLFVSAGNLNQRRLDQPDQLFVNAGQGAFLDLSTPAGIADGAIGRGVSFADYDRDGRVDAYVVNVDGSPALWRNTTVTASHWLGVQLHGTISNRDACGSMVVVRTAGRDRARWRLCGASLGAGNDSVLAFGGVAPGPYTVRVTWPSGRVQTVRGSSVDRVLEIVERRTA